MNNITPKAKTLYLRVTAEFHKRVKIRACECNQSAQDFIIEAIEKHLSEPYPELSPVEGVTKRVREIVESPYVDKLQP